MMPQGTPTWSCSARYATPAIWRGVSPGANALATATESAADDDSPAPTGTSDATATHADKSRSIASSAQSSRNTPPTYAAQFLGSSSSHLSLTGVLSRVEIASSTPGTPGAPGPTAAVVRCPMAIGSTGPPL